MLFYICWVVGEGTVCTHATTAKQRKKHETKARDRGEESEEDKVEESEETRYELLIFFSF